MSAPALSYADIRALNPCHDDFARVTKLLGGARKWSKPIDAAAARKAGVLFYDITWTAFVVARNNPDVERRMQLWLADCAAHVLQIYERDHPQDDRPRNAIIAGRQFVRGQTSAAARAAARDAARAAASAAAWEAAWDAASDAASAAARAAASAAAWDAAWDAARDVAWAAARAAAWDAAWDARDAASDAVSAAARAAEEAWQYDRLILWLSADEPDDWPLPVRISAGEAA